MKTNLKKKSEKKIWKKSEKKIWKKSGKNLCFNQLPWPSMVLIDQSINIYSAPSALYAESEKMLKKI